eukprot:gb/GECG01016586.1/.p1 GENE.gb/GECG01016586.1/~~gb/GECG01016586.1/.p1  ORF type:complete len:274 (+),score=30.55 gb/GECG01016586.1/:1-822(+)
MASNSGKETLYVLKLQRGKYYVGITKKTVQERFQQHLKGEGGAQWTRKYKPVCIVEACEAKDRFDEDAKVKRLMGMYGIGNVRGGSYSTVDLEEEDYDLLQRELDSGQGRCYACGSKDHYVNKCPAVLADLENPDNFYSFSPSSHCSPQEDGCWKCGSLSHFIAQCPHNKQQPKWKAMPYFGKGTGNFSGGSSKMPGSWGNGSSSWNKGSGTKRRLNDIPGPINSSWKSSTSSKSARSCRSGPSSLNCFRCGRGTHWAQDCFARTDVLGRYID